MSNFSQIPIAYAFAAIHCVYARSLRLERRFHLCELVLPFRFISRAISRKYNFHMRVARIYQAHHSL